MVGGIGTLAHYLTLITLVDFMDVEPVMASAFGFLVGALVNYLLNYHVTFKSQKKHRSAFGKFLLIATVGFFLNTALMAALVPFLHYLFAQIIATLIVLFWNFTGSRIWAFR